MKKLIISVGFLLLFVSCNSNDEVTGKVVETEISKAANVESSNMSKNQLDSREKVKLFFVANKFSSIRKVKELLWSPQKEYMIDGQVFLWFIYEHPSFVDASLEDSDEMILNGFTLKFREDKLIDYDLEFR